LPFAITVAAGTGGESGHGTDQTGFLTFDVISDRESHTGTWNFVRKVIVGTEVVAALPSIEFLQEMHAPNVLQIAQKYGQFQDYAEIPPNDYVFPDALVDYLRALAIIQRHTAIPILIPDLTTVTVAAAHAVAEAAAVITGQTILTAWDSLAMAGDASLEEAGPEQNIDFAGEYELLVTEKLVVTVGEQELVLGSVAQMALSARYEVDNGNLFARPHRNDTMQKWFSPLPDAAGSLERCVLGRVIGTIGAPAG
jgi:hypothetical protein